MGWVMECWKIYSGTKFSALSSILSIRIDIHMVYSFREILTFVAAIVE